MTKLKELKKELQLERARIRKLHIDKIRIAIKNGKGDKNEKVKNKKDRN